MSEKNRHPLVSFFEHQRDAVTEAGKAVLALLPRDVREHSKKAFQHSTEGFKIVGDAIGEEVKKGVDKVNPFQKESETKMEVEVE